MIGQAYGLPRVVNVADKQGHSDAGDDAAPDVFVHDLLTNRNGANIGQSLHGKEGAQQGGQIVKKEL
jgi:hypothetical protein